ncbi:AAA family ATPase [Brachybacterium sp. MASK1Z-5]|uniref:AAA family ATPase n=1 Tax=Brachybacterium halotolerans TaxID=2795215 RepID=A0ABS1BE54_9MICO|nr:AAA family ATPase [Brachybacterium halotolerans]MBK0332876.1 AAA family ATPase [Brachybacterium halotolerans]
MHAQLDQEVAERSEAQQRALAAPVGGPADAYARDVEVHRLAERIHQLRAAERSLCFGRIDGSGDGPSAPEGGLHIGRIGMRTPEGGTLLVDWRAEAARPFYAATMVSPMGLRRRRHLRTDGRRVVGVSDEILDGSAPLPGDVVGDGPLTAALSGPRTGRMREAASTLQAEQDEIVRSSHRGVTVVDGGPGTGKTIVALHRAAFVLYAWSAIAGRGVMVFGPNRRFLTYISDVLPSLGENDVHLATLSDLVGAEPTRAEPDRIARLKGRAELADALAAHVREHQPHGVPLTLRTAHDTVVLDAALVDAARRSALQGASGHTEARALFLEAIVDDLVSELEARTTREDSAFEAELEAAYGLNLDRAVAGDLTRMGGGAQGTGADLDIDWEQIHEDLLEDPAVDRAVGTVWPRLDPEDVVRRVLADPAALARALPVASAEDLEQMAGTHSHAGAGGPTAWTFADLALLDEARALVDGPPEDVVGHIVVDEAQQLSPMQWRALVRRCPERSMTVVGDLAQAGPTSTIRSWDEALAPFVQDRFEHRTLSVNYRTTAEILESTRELLGRIAPQQRLSRSLRHGEDPTRVPSSRGGLLEDLRRAVDGLRASDPDGLVGVITTAADADAAQDALRGTGASVVPAPDARGLEFDSVIVVDPSAIEAAGEAGERDLYVARTRATHRLVTLEPGWDDPES